MHAQNHNFSGPCMSDCRGLGNRRYYCSHRKRKLIWMSTPIHIISMELAALLLMWQKSLLLLVLLTSCSAQSIHYVTPTPNTSCPGEPCHTLSQYVAGQYFNNLPANTTMEFLPGNHTLEKTVSVANTARLTLHGSILFSLPEDASRILCTWPAGFVFTNNTGLYISAIAFISCGHNTNTGAAVSILSVQQCDISNCTFQNTNYYNLVVQTAGALYVEDSTLNLSGNTFQNNFADCYGGALYVVGSSLNLTGNIFQNNSVDCFGGALLNHVRERSLSLTGNSFKDNSADIYGGALHIWNSTHSFTENTFQNNSAHSNLSLTRSTFQNNFAHSYGGALYI